MFSVEDEALYTGPKKINTSEIDTEGRFENVSKSFYDQFRESDLTFHEDFVEELRKMDFKDVFKTIFKGDDPKLVGKWKEKILLRLFRWQLSGPDP